MLEYVGDENYQLSQKDTLSVHTITAKSRTFTFKPKGASALRANLKAIYRYRDLAVHPSGRIEAPMLHPELDLGMEW